MEPLTFHIAAGATSEDGFCLTPCPLSDVSAWMWEDLAAEIAKEASLMPCTAAVLRARCASGCAELTIHDGRIVHYSSFAPIAQPGTGPHSWSALAECLNADAAALPAVDVYELASGWTDPAWRGMGINRVLRQRLVQRTLCGPSGGSSLGISGMAGVAAPLDKRLGWQMLAWDAAPYVTSLIAVRAYEFPLQAAMGWRPPGGLRPYQGQQSPREDPSRHWEDGCFCWTSNADLATRLDSELAALLEGNLSRWRSAVVATFEKSESWHRLAFLG